MLALAAGPAAGCAIDGPPPGWRDARIAVGADCSFTEAGSTYELPISGRAAVDLGDGRIGQRLESSGYCTQSEFLLVVDCNRREMISITGVEYGNDLTGGFSVDQLYAPRGAIRLSRRPSVGQLVSIAERAGYEYRLGLPEFIDDLGRRNRPDPFCGCRLFYPDSPGASE
jgi:hypothetical protein